MPDSSLPQLDADVAVLEDLGSDVHVIFPVDAPRIDTEEFRERAAEEALIAGDGAVFTARVDARTSARPGSTLRLSLDPAGLYWFDPESGAALPTRAGRGAAVAPPAVVACLRFDLPSGRTRASTRKGRSDETTRVRGACRGDARDRGRLCGSA